VEVRVAPSATSKFGVDSFLVVFAFTLNHAILQMEIGKIVYNGLASLRRKVLHDFKPSYSSPRAPI
jgi:hypothetical protein